jgi:acyl carrier protein
LKKLLKISQKTPISSDLNINSANLVDIILDVEDYFKIHIDNESMEKMIDVKSTLEIIETKLAKVIGNDIVDLALQKESNWKRPDIWIKYLLKTSSY